MFTFSLTHWGSSIMVSSIPFEPGFSIGHEACDDRVGDTGTAQALNQSTATEANIVRDATYGVSDHQVQNASSRPIHISATPCSNTHRVNSQPGYIQPKHPSNARCLLLVVSFFCSVLLLPVKAQGTADIGKVVAWGANNNNQISIPNLPANGNVTAIAASYASNASMALLSSGTVIVWGDTAGGQSKILNGVQGSAIGIAIGWLHCLALLRNQSVAAWGDNSYRQLNIPPAIQGSVSAVAAGVAHNLALQDDNVVAAWGDNRVKQLNVPAGIQGFVTTIAAGCYHNLALLIYGKVVAWGSNLFNQCTVPRAIQGRVTAIAAGCWHSMALLNNGTVVAWGFNGQQLTNIPAGIQGKVTAIAASGYNSMALLNDGTMVVWGDNSFDQANVPPAIQGYVTAIAAGRNFSLAIVESSAPFFAPPPPPPNPPPVPLITSLPTSNPSTFTSGSSANGPNTSGIAGGVTAGGLIMIAGAVAVFWFRIKQRRGSDTAVDQANEGPSQDDPTRQDDHDGSVPPAVATVIVTTHPIKSEPSIKQTGSHSGFPPYMESTTRMSDGNERNRKPSSYANLSEANSNAQLGSDFTAAMQRRVLGSLHIPWSDIELGREVGRGGFGTVYVGSWQGNKVAVKMLNKEHMSEKARAALHHEVLMMCELRHPCIAPAYGLVDEGEHHALVMRYYRSGTLSDAMRTFQYHSLDLVSRLKIALQVATGIRRLHEAQPTPIIHGDLKTSNILLEDGGSWRVVISDFGLACSVYTNDGQGASRPADGMTIHISPPEVLEDPYAPRSLAVDSYAFAIVLLEIIQGAPLYRGMRTAEIVDAVKMGRRPGIPATVPDDIAALVQACWAQNPAERPGFKECTERLKQSIDEHSNASAFGPDYMNTTTVVKTDGTMSWY